MRFSVSKGNPGQSRDCPLPAPRRRFSPLRRNFPRHPPAKTGFQTRLSLIFLPIFISSFFPSAKTPYPNRVRRFCCVRTGALASSQAPHHSSPCKHADSFALLLVLSKPKHRFGFARRNGGADVELSGLPGKRNGASPFGRYPLPRSSFPSRKSSLRLGDAGSVTHLLKAFPSRGRCHGGAVTDRVACGTQRGLFHPISFCSCRKKPGGA